MTLNRCDGEEGIPAWCSNPCSSSRFEFAGDPGRLPGTAQSVPPSKVIFVDAATTSALIVAGGSLPAGIAAALAARRLSHTDKPAIWTAVASCLGLGLWAAYVMPPGLLLAASCVLGWTLLVLAIVDGLALRLPDVLTLPLIAAGLSVSGFLPAHDLLGHAIGPAVGLAAFWSIAMLYRAMRGQEGLGM